MLQTLESYMGRIEIAMRQTQSGMISSMRGQDEVDRAVGRLWAKLELTPDIEAALGAVRDRATHYFADRIFQNSGKRQRAYRELRSASERLRVLLETAHVAFLDRNEAQIFAKRTLKNLNYILAQRQAQRAGVHLVTMLTGSLLGLIVFVKERHLDHYVGTLDLARLATRDGFPNWNITLGQGECQTLGALIHRLRNAVAHGRVYFASDDAALENVLIEFEDVRPGENRLPHWRASIYAADLLTFCTKFSALVDGYLG